MRIGDRVKIGDRVWVALIGGLVTVLTALMGMVMSQINQVHHLVNSAASAQQAKIDSAAVEISALKQLVMTMQLMGVKGDSLRGR